MPLARSFLLILVLLGSLRPSAAGAQPLTVTLDLSSLSPRTFDRIDGDALEKQILVRLVQDGYAVVAGHSEAAVSLTLEERADQLVLTGRRNRTSLPRSLKWARLSAVELRWRLAQESVELVRLLATEAPPAPVAPPVVQQPEREAPPPVLLSAQEPVRSWLFSLMAGGLYRPHSLDVSLGGVLQRRWQRWMVEGALQGSWSEGTQIDVWEASASVGPGLRTSFTPDLEGSVALRAGLLLQRYSVSAPGAEQPSGTHWDPLVSVALALGWQVWKPLVVGARIEPGFIPHTYVHALGETELWQRSAFRLQMAGWIGLAW